MDFQYPDFFNQVEFKKIMFERNDSFEQNNSRLKYRYKSKEYRHAFSYPFSQISIGVERVTNNLALYLQKKEHFPLEYHKILFEEVFWHC